MELTDVRKNIDKIDDQIAELFDKRMDLSREVGLAKAQAGTVVDVPEREKAIIERLSQKVSPEKQGYLKQLYDTVFCTSKAYQNQFVSANSSSVQAIRAAIAQNMQAPVEAKVACQGIRGAYSDIAAHKVFNSPDILYFKTFEGVFNAIDAGMCQYGILPIENSNTGSISQVYDLMQSHKFYIVNSVRLHVHHSLVAKVGVKLDQIKKVISHEQGLLQCKEFLENLGVETQVVKNTAVAARMIAESNDKTVAAICSEESADIYKLEVLKKDIQDNGNNDTRFICISKNLEIYGGANKMSVVLKVSHSPGSLNRVLNRFAALNLNLTKLESRPISNSDFEFMFYLDYECDITDETVLNLIGDLENTTDCLFLGGYKECL